MSTRNLCYVAKIRKIGIPLHQFYYIKVGSKGLYIAGTCLPDGGMFNYECSIL